ncbi:hypothetical protein PMKS-001482 [Pichia membranifaciens]|uniref:Cation efflux protein transmembrane domain-containing protein n=1 Tax=Pichia membranifaciens TaxID=4926 RepID=A0A1Q2YEQ7_9ASCO|nr:hypothetical protein PMKS-001482 [Pichia membranifaciens]
MPKKRPFIDDDSVDPISPYVVREETEGHSSERADEAMMPRLHRSKTFSETLNLDHSVSLPVSVNNPLNLGRRLSVFPGNNFDELYKRVDSLKLMRPFRLIGHVMRLVNWKNYKLTDEEIGKIKKRQVRDFYREQNDLIDRYEDIDMLLDTGIQLQMIQNYADNTSTDTTSDNSEFDGNDDEQALVPRNADSLTVPLSAQNMKKKFSADTEISETSKGTRKKRHILPSAVPGNIDLEGAKILGSPHESSSSIVLYAIYFNFFLNVVLLAGKIVVVYLSDSLSLIASLVDSALDFLSTLIIFIANRYAIKASSKFPVGRKQLEPIGVLIFSVIIILSFSQVLIECLKQLFASGAEKETVTLTRTAIAIMVGTISTKFVGYELCKNINNSSVRALVEDAKTDIVFNVFSLIFPAVGVFLDIWWIDPLGATLLCCYVIVQWWMITFEHIDHLSGSNAPKEDYQQVLYMIVRFTDEIAKVKNYRLYHMGDQVNAEVDIVLQNPKMSLKDCHDLGESLQYAIETLPYVNRCFVHIDYKVRNYVGHLNG